MVAQSLSAAIQTGLKHPSTCKNEEHVTQSSEAQNCEQFVFQAGAGATIA
jgi:hypothetical protein